MIEELSDIQSMITKNTSTEIIEEILLNVIHGLEPVGVGFRDFKECIKIQIEKKISIKRLKAMSADFKSKSI